MQLSNATHWWATRLLSAAARWCDQNLFDKIQFQPPVCHGFPLRLLPQSRHWEKTGFVESTAKNMATKTCTKLIGHKHRNYWFKFKSLQESPPPPLKGNIDMHCFVIFVCFSMFNSISNFKIPKNLFWHFSIVMYIRWWQETVQISRFYIRLPLVISQNKTTTFYFYTNPNSFWSHLV